MTDYRPLIERLISSLPSHDAGARDFAYQRARKALERQFEDVSATTRNQFAGESAALEHAISIVEARIAHEEGLAAAVQNEIAEPSSIHQCTALAHDVAEPESFETGLSISDARKAWRAKWRVASSTVLGLLLIGGSCIACLTIYNVRGAPSFSEGSSDDAVRVTTGVSVPPPIAQASLSGWGDNAAEAGEERAALLVDAPSNPQRLETHVGTVAWHLIRSEIGSRKPGTVKVQATVNIPDAKLTAELVFDKNIDLQLSASHTINIKFLSRSGSLIEAVDQIEMPEMRDENAPTGVRLAGTQARITSDRFLVGLTGGPSKNLNLRLLQSRSWIDLPMLLEGHHKIAKLTFEKGTTGGMVLTEAFRAWSQTGNLAESSALDPIR